MPGENNPARDGPSISAASHGLPTPPQASQRSHEAEVKHPTRREMAEWIIAYVREKNPPMGSAVPWEDLEVLLGEMRDSHAFIWSVQDALDEMLEVEPRMVFRRDHILGLVRLSDEEQAPYSENGMRQARRKVIRSLKILNATDLTKLTTEQKAEHDRTRLRLLFVEKAHRDAMKRGFLSPPPDPKQIT